jgi:elongation factor Ts
MNISMSLIQELRNLTQAGMVACKNALSETKGDLQAAIKLLERQGQVNADRKSERIAAEGLIAINEDDDAVAMLEVNCETDFVTRSDLFKSFVDELSALALREKVIDLNALLELPFSDTQTVQQQCKLLIAKLGENIRIRRFISIAKTPNVVGHYLYMNKIGVIVQLRDGDEALARDLAIHIVASHPQVITREEIAPEVIEREREIYFAQLESSGKPKDVIERIVSGRIDKFLSQVSLVDQAFIKDPQYTVAQVLSQAKAKVIRFIRFTLGEGLEKQDSDFADSVRQELEKY